MTTQLFFTSVAPATNAYYYFTGNNDANLAGVAKSWGVRTLSTSRGSAKVAYTVATVTGPTSGLEILSGGVTYHFWISQPLNADVTISGTVTFNLWMGENATANNAGAQCVVERIDSTGAIISTITNSEKAVELPKTSSIAAQNWTATPTSTAMKKGDRLRIRAACNDAGGTMASDATGVTFDFAGTTGGADGDSYVTFNETFSFLTADPTTLSVYPTTTASVVDPGGASVDTYEAWTARGSGVTTAITNTAAGYTAPLQITTGAGGNYIEWFTRTLQAFTLAAPVLVNSRVVESDVPANVGIRCELAVTANDGTSPVVWGANTPGPEVGTSEGAQQFWVTGADLAVTAGQRIRIRFYIDDSTSAAMGGSLTATLYYAGTSGGASGDTYLTFGQTLTASASLPSDTRHVQRNSLLRR